MPKLPALFVALAALVPTVHANPAPIDLNKMLTQKAPGTHIGNTIQSATQRANDLVLTAMGFLDRPYRLGGMSAETGFDCSGFVHAMYQQSIGLKLPRRAAEQAAATRKIDKAELRPGDLVFFNTMRRPHSHVGIYVGEGKFIHAPRTGARVRVENMNVSYWQKRFDGARRVALPEAAPATPAPGVPPGVQLAAWQPGTAELPHKDNGSAVTPAVLSDAAPAAMAALPETAASQTAPAPAKAVIRRASPAPRQVRLGSGGASSTKQAKQAAAQNGKTASVRMAASAVKGSAVKGTARKTVAGKTAKATAKASTQAASGKRAPAARKNAVAAATAKKPRRV